MQCDFNRNVIVFSNLTKKAKTRETDVYYTPKPRSLVCKNEINSIHTCVLVSPTSTTKFCPFQPVFKDNPV